VGNICTPKLAKVFSNCLPPVIYAGSVQCIKNVNAQYLNNILSLMLLFSWTE
jgi:hypothetical protein